MSLLTGACGITAPRSDEGFADFDSLGMFDTDRSVTVSIGPRLLHLAARFSDRDAKQRALLRELNGVRVKVYEIDGNVDRVVGRMARMNRKLREQGWDPVAVMQDDGERTYMLMKSAGGRIQGLTLMASDGEEEVVFVNIMGNLDPRHFSDAMQVLDVSAPDVQLASAP